jgi:hypothetical protein
MTKQSKKLYLPMNESKNCSYRQYLNYLTYDKLYSKVRKIEEHEIKYKFIGICDFLKEQSICGTATTKLLTLLIKFF